MGYSSSYAASTSPEASDDTARAGAGGKRPRRACRQHTDSVVQEQARAELEDHRQLLDLRTVKLKEKNKRAQQRFRERQKEKSAQANMQAEKLQQQVVQLRARVAAAEDRCQLLDRVMLLHQPQIANSKASLQQQGMEKAASVFEPYKGFSALPEGEFVMVLHGCSRNEHVKLSRTQMEAMEFSQCTAMWRIYVDQMAVALMGAQGDLLSDAARHLQGLNNELFAWCIWMNRLVPHTLPKLHNVSMDESSSAAPPDPQQLLTSLRQLGLTAEQMEHLIAARRFCLATLASLMRERHSMNKTLQEVIEGGSSWGNMYASHPAMVELQQRLAHNVDAESSAFHTFMTSALRRVLNPIQTASLVVQSAPFMPPVMAVITRLSSDSGEGSDDDLLLLDAVPTPVSLAMGPADSLGMSLDALWDDIYLT